jgi:hypothetical protein
MTSFPIGVCGRLGVLREGRALGGLGGLGLRKPPEDAERNENSLEVERAESAEDAETSDGRTNGESAGGGMEAAADS